jgi:prolyl oligopeptidase PreP (S9A serine peptidase family)
MLDSQQETSFRIDPEFKSLIPPLTDGEREHLTTNLLSNGCREPLVVWVEEKLLLDGHNRHEICTKNDIFYKIEEISLSDRQSAINWIVNNQLGRRNLTAAHLSYFRGKVYNSSKLQGQRNDLTCDQNGHKLEVDTENDTCDQNGHKLSADKENDTCDQNGHKLKTAQKLALEHKVGEGTIRRDGKFASALDLLAETLGNEVRGEFLRKDTPITRQMILELAEIAEKEPAAAQKTLVDFRKGLLPLKKARHLELSSGSLVEIKSNKPEISQKLAKVAVVNQSTVLVVLRNTETMEMVQHRLKLEEVEPVPLEKEPKVEAIALRLGRVREKAIDPFEREMVDLLDKRVALTPVEEEYLTGLEVKYSLI